MKAFPGAAVAASAAAALVLGGCAATPESSERAESLTIAVTALATNWDPVVGGNVIYGTSSQPLYESLIIIDLATNEYRPWLAEEFALSEDRRTLTLTLRDDVVFTDGESLTAEGVKKQYDAVFEAGSNYIVHESLSFEPEMTVTGEHTLEITTVNGISNRFLDTLTYLPIVSPAAIDDLETLASTPAGTGPYLLDEEVTDVSQTFVRNPDYWNPDAFDFDTVTFRVFADPVAAANALSSGQVDAAQLQIAQVETIEDAGFTIAVGGGDIFNIIWFDRTGAVSPAVADKRVRQAISMAFDRESIIENLELGYGEARSQTFAEGSPQYIEGGDDRYPYDPERARELLAEAGYPDGFELTIPTFGDQERYLPVIEQSLADIGITVVWDKFTDGAEYIGATTSKAYPLVMQATGEAGLLAYLGPGGYFNAFGPADPYITEVFSRIENGTAEESAAASQELGEFLLDEAWYIPVSQRSWTWGLAAGVDAEVGTRLGWPISLIDFTVAD